MVPSTVPRRVTKHPCVNLISTVTSIGAFCKATERTSTFGMYSIRENRVQNAADSAVQCVPVCTFDPIRISKYKDLHGDVDMDRDGDIRTTQ